MKSRNILLSILTLVLVICWAPALKAQLDRGVLEGVVVDAQGGVVPGVDVTVTVGLPQSIERLYPTLIFPTLPALSVCEKPCEKPLTARRNI
jgi:hypothetical protein